MYYLKLRRHHDGPLGWTEGREEAAMKEEEEEEEDALDWLQQALDVRDSR